MDQQKLSFPILKAAHWSVPIKSEDAADEQTATFANWILWVRVRSLPSDLPLDPNARNPVLEGRIPEAIEATLRERPVEFVRLNSGLTIVARACNVRDYQATLILQSFSEKEEQEDGRRGDGLLNGGHTYAIIQQVLKDTPADAIPAGMPDPGEAVVRVEVQTGLREEDLADISRARKSQSLRSRISRESGPALRLNSHRICASGSHLRAEIHARQTMPSTWTLATWSSSWPFSTIGFIRQERRSL